jgi:hypothetical protein
LNGRCGSAELRLPMMSAVITDKKYLVAKKDLYNKYQTKYYARTPCTNISWWSVLGRAVPVPVFLPVPVFRFFYPKNRISGSGTGFFRFYVSLLVLHYSLQFLTLQWLHAENCSVAKSINIQNCYNLLKLVIIVICFVICFVW